MVNNFETIKSYVLTLTNLEDSATLDIQIQMKIDEILAYCYRETIPAKMVLPVADVIASSLQSGIEGDIQSYKEGDMSITYATASDGVKFNGKLEGFKLVKGLVKCSEEI